MPTNNTAGSAFRHIIKRIYDQRASSLKWQLNTKKKCSLLICINRRLWKICRRIINDVSELIFCGHLERWTLFVVSMSTGCKKGGTLLDQKGFFGKVYWNALPVSFFISIGNAFQEHYLRATSNILKSLLTMSTGCFTKTGIMKVPKYCFFILKETPWIWSYRWEWESIKNLFILVKIKQYTHFHAIKVYYNESQILALLIKRDIKLNFFCKSYNSSNKIIHGVKEKTIYK